MVIRHSYGTHTALNAKISINITSENIFNDDLIFSINENIFAMLRIEDLSTERNQIYTYIKQIFDQIIQNHSIQMQFVNKIWSQSLGNLLLNYIKTDNMIEHLLLTLKLIYLLLDAQYAKIFFSENQLNDTVFETLTSFPEEFQLRTRTEAVFHLVSGLYVVACRVDIRVDTCAQCVRQRRNRSI